MAGQSTMEGFAKMMAVKTVVGGGIGKLNEKFAFTKSAKIEKMVKERQTRKKKEQNEKIYEEEKNMAEDYAREKGSLIQAIADGWNGVERINDIEQAEAEAYSEARRKSIEYGDKLTGQHQSSMKKANAAQIAGVKTDAEWWEGSTYRKEAFLRKRLKEEESAYQDNIKWESDAIVKATQSGANSPTIKVEPGNPGGGDSGGGVGFGGGDIIAAIEELTITTLDTNVLLKGLGSPSVNLPVLHQLNHKKLLLHQKSVMCKSFYGVNARW